MDIKRFSDAVALRDSGRVQRAYDELLALSELTTDAEDQAALLANEARCCLLLGNLEAARRLISQALEITPRTESILYIWFEDAVLCWHEGRRKESLKILDDLREENKETLFKPAHSRLFQQIETMRAIVLTELGRFEDARRMLERCLEFDLNTQDRADVLYNLAVCRMKMGNPERAKEVFLEALKNGPSEAYIAAAHYNLGIIYSREGAAAKALQEFEWCASHGKDASIPRGKLYGWLAKVSDDLGLKAETEYYRRLANGELHQGSADLHS